MASGNGTIVKAIVSGILCVGVLGAVMLAVKANGDEDKRTEVRNVESHKEITAIHAKDMNLVTRIDTRQEVLIDDVGEIKEMIRALK